jgi:hypothetical protein
VIEENTRTSTVVRVRCRGDLADVSVDKTSKWRLLESVVQEGGRRPCREQPSGRWALYPAEDGRGRGSDRQLLSSADVCVVQQHSANTCVLCADTGGSFDKSNRSFRNTVTAVSVWRTRGKFDPMLEAVLSKGGGNQFGVDT